jgi:hypothetical protein
VTGATFPLALHNLKTRQLRPSTMTQDEHRTTNILSNSDSEFVASALRRGATRRDVMGLLVAAGMSSAVATGRPRYPLEGRGEQVDASTRSRIHET